jgi:hypothetical protein
MISTSDLKITVSLHPVNAIEGSSLPSLNDLSKPLPASELESSADTQQSQQL